MAISSVDLGLPPWEIVIILTCGLGLSSFALSGSNLDYSWNDARQGSSVYFICVVFTKSCFHVETCFLSPTLWREITGLCSGATFHVETPVFFYPLYGGRLQIYVPKQPSSVLPSF